MASVEHSKVETVIVEESFTLTLTRDEAQTLKDVMGLIGGAPVSTRRKHTDSILAALMATKALVTHSYDTTGTIYFNQHAEN